EWDTGPRVDCAGIGEDLTSVAWTRTRIGDHPATQDSVAFGVRRAHGAVELADMVGWYLPAAAAELDPALAACAAAAGAGGRAAGRGRRRRRRARPACRRSSSTGASCAAR